MKGIWKIRNRARWPAFTLVELLVVISILALLIAILVPSLRGARKVSKRVVCGANLRSIGQGMRMYLNESNDYLPVVERVPSVPLDPANPLPGIAEVLQPFIRANPDTPNADSTGGPAISDEVFQCPADTPGKDSDRSPENRNKSYFDTEGSSYVFNTFLHFLRDDASMTGGSFREPIKLSEVVRTDRSRNLFGGQPAEEEIWLMRDYFGFHGKKGDTLRTNYLYVDGRVTDLVR